MLLRSAITSCTSKMKNCNIRLFTIFYSLLLLYLVDVESTEKVVEDTGCQFESACLQIKHGSGGVVSPKKSLIFGPGLKEGLVLPVRYFFIQIVDQNGHNLTVSPPGKLKVKVTDGRGTTTQWTQVFDRHEGSFIVRFRLFHEADGLMIHVLYDDVNVAQSPYFLSGPQYEEQCYCPQPAKFWMNSMQCNGNYSQIATDLEKFPQIDMTFAVEEAVKRFNIPGAYSFCHYSVIKNQVYRKCYGQHVGFKMFMDEFLLSITRKVVLPDVEMLVNLGDWPLEQKKQAENIIPFFSWCGSAGSHDIVMPTYDLTESSLEMMGRVMLDILSVQSTSEPPWEGKVDKAFWQGRDSRLERLQLIEIARQHPDLMNASLTNFFFFREQEKTHGPRAPHIPFFSFFRYKYQLNIDGTVAAYRFPYLLAGDGVVLKQDSDYYEHFYHQLRPMEHYVPFKKDLSDLVDKIHWAREHDSQVLQIAKNARNFALDNLLPQHIYCYAVKLLTEYNLRLTNTPTKKDDMEFVPQPVSKKQCSCVNNLESNTKEEL